MGIKDFHVETYAFAWSGQPIATLRGISANDIAVVLTSESDNIQKIFEAIEGPLNDKQAMSIDFADKDAVAAILSDRAKPMMMGLLSQFPAVIAKVIACAADEPHLWSEYLRLPLPAQMQAITEIARLTFVDAAGFETFVGNVVALSRNIPGRQAAPKPQLRSVGSAT